MGVYTPEDIDADLARYLNAALAGPSDTASEAESEVEDHGADSDESDFGDWGHTDADGNEIPPGEGEGEGDGDGDGGEGGEGGGGGGNGGHTGEDGD